MTPSEFVQLALQACPNLPAPEVLDKVDFKHNGKDGWDDSDDANAYFREEVVELLFAIDHRTYHDLIRYLLKAELEYASEETMMRETLRQLTFMIYQLGAIEDIPLLVQAKTDTCFDAGIGLDLELVFGLDRHATKAHFQAHPDSKYDVVACIEKYEDYEYRSPEAFIAGMKSYYGQTE